MTQISLGSVPFEVWTKEDLKERGFSHVEFEEKGVKNQGYLITDDVVLPKRLYWQYHPSDYWVKAATVFRGGELHLDGSKRTTSQTQKFGKWDLRLFSSDTDDDQLAKVMRLINNGKPTEEILMALYGDPIPKDAAIPGWSIRRHVFNRTYTLGEFRGLWSVAYKTGKVRSVQITEPFFVGTLDRETPLFYNAGSFLIEGVDKDGKSFTGEGESRDFYANNKEKVKRYTEWIVG